MRTDFGTAGPYNWLKNPVDPNSQDFKNVMNWLAGYGVAITDMVGQSGKIVWDKPSLSYIILSSGGFQSTNAGQQPGPILQLTFDGYTLPMDAALVMNDPGIVLLMLGLDSGNTPNYTPPASPTPVPQPLGGQPKDPIGAQISSTQFNAATGDISPNGAVYSDSRGMFTKSVVPGPFGSAWVWWTLIPTV